ncbi:MAG: hypothetical protein IPJ30_05285 [Acidobacteria bacterium]|nr:hypothetical protein [Acidobacteriota bacterium]
MFETHTSRVIGSAQKRTIERIQEENRKAGLDEILIKLRYERRSIRVSENEVEEISRQFFKHVQKSGTIESASVRQMKQKEWNLMLHAGFYSASFDGTSSDRIVNKRKFDHFETISRRAAAHRLDQTDLLEIPERWMNNIEAHSNSAIDGERMRNPLELTVRARKTIRRRECLKQRQRSFRFGHRFSGQIL